MSLPPTLRKAPGSLSWGSADTLTALATAARLVEDFATCSIKSQCFELSWFLHAAFDSWLRSALDVCDVNLGLEIVQIRQGRIFDDEEMIQQRMFVQQSELWEFGYETAQIRQGRIFDEGEMIQHRMFVPRSELCEELKYSDSDLHRIYPGIVNMSTQQVVSVRQAISTEASLGTRLLQMDLNKLRAECRECGLAPAEYSTGTTTELRTLLRIMLSADIGREIAYWNMCKSQPDADGCNNHNRKLFEDENKARHDIRSQRQAELLHTMNHRPASEDLTQSS